MVPGCLHLEMLERIHAGHQGIVKCRARARQSVLWSGLNGQLEDLVHHIKYLLLIDYYPRYIEIAKLSNETSLAVINHFKLIFTRDGIPQAIYSDNGPQYSSLEFKMLTKEYGFKHLTSRPRYPQSNGESERAVQTLKNLRVICCINDMQIHTTRMDAVQQSC